MLQFRHPGQVSRTTRLLEVELGLLNITLNLGRALHGSFLC